MATISHIVLRTIKYILAHTVMIPHIALTETKSIPVLTAMMSHIALMEVKFTQAHTDMMLLFELTVTKYIPEVMGMMLRTGLIGKINVFRLKHPLPMLNMYCILELRRGITIPQAETMSLHDYLVIGIKAGENYAFK